MTRIKKQYVDLKDCATKTFDLIIIGAGPAGCVLAILMARAGWSVALVDKSDFQSPRIGEHLSPKGHALINHLELGEILNPKKHLKSDRVCSYWGTDKPHFQDYFMSPFGSGWNLDRLQFDIDLCVEAQKAGCQILSQTQVTAITFYDSERQWQLAVSDRNKHQSQLISRYLVDATGRRAYVAHHLGVKRNRLDKLVGVLAHLECPRYWGSMSNNLYLQSAKYGWLYSLKLPDRKLAVVLMTDSDIVGSLLKQRKSQALIDIFKNSKTGSAFKEQTFSNETQVNCFSYPADSGYLENFTGTQWLAIGDAALSFDPLASRGIGFALETAVRAAEALKSDNNQAGEYSKYNEFLADTWQKYLKQRPEVFNAEKRWTNAPFWQRRIISPE